MSELGQPLCRTDWSTRSRYLQLIPSAWGKLTARAHRDRQPEVRQVKVVNVPASSNNIQRVQALKKVLHEFRILKTQSGFDILPAVERIIITNGTYKNCTVKPTISPTYESSVFSHVVSQYIQLTHLLHFRLCYLAIRILWLELSSTNQPEMFNSSDSGRVAG